MLGISRQTDYAARVVLHLACLAPGARVPIADIAKNRMLPLEFVRRIVGELVKAGGARRPRVRRGESDRLGERDSAPRRAHRFREAAEARAVVARASVEERR